ncbi:MAG: permease [Fusobacteria bacterium]|nr:MAG: permease [Fusobacteriota bacterium]KAF0230212.1 MAG: hypothetical protein FD182_602 [Fusobacteriota bacterium]
MIKLPKKHSVKWIYILIALFVLTFVSMFFVTTILDLRVSLDNLSGFAILSLAVSLAIGLGGLLGSTAYFKTALLFNILGIIYMFVITIFKTAEGWSDLVSIISYMFILSIGIILGVIVQLVLIIITGYKKKKTQTSQIQSEK